MTRPVSPALLFLSCLPLAIAGCGNSTVTGSSGAQACVTAAACSAVTSVSSCSAFVAGVNNPSFAASAHLSGAQVNCLAGAGTSCAAARRCLNGGMDPQPCTSGAVSCSGTHYNFCGNLTGQNGQEATQQFDCAAANEMCVGGPNGNVDCGLGTCSAGGGTCVGNKLQSCDNGILHELDCAEYGGTCVSTIGIAHCRGSGPACTANNPLNPLAVLRCDGSSEILCADGQEAHFDCGQLQEGCFQKPDGTFGCALGNECDPNNFSATCNGLKLNFCNNGKKATFDCGALGFHGCDPQNGGRCTL